MKKYLEIGRAVTVHGINGELKLYPWCDSTETLCTQKTLWLDAEGKSSVDIESARAHKNMCLVKIKGVDTIEQARVYIEKVFYADRDNIPRQEGDVFVVDLIGARVVTDTGEAVGEISDVTNNGAHDLLNVKMSSGELRFIPYVKAFVKSVSVDDGVVEIIPIKGLLFDED
ncbi:MAG: ribosome maturation factor RimM [Oscillospiraceae bacterium]